MNKKLIALALASTVVAGSAFANNSFYLGAEVNYNSPKYKNVTATSATEVKKNKYGIGFEVGAKFNENFGVGVGYNFFKKSKRTNASGVEVSSKLKNLFVDLFGYYPVSEEVNLVGSLGMGKLKPTVAASTGTVSAPANVNKGKFKPRVGFGAEYKFDDNVSTRFMVRYQKGHNVIKSNMQGGLGLFYTF